MERARIYADGGRVLCRVASEDMCHSYSVPHANLAILFLGQGTSITQDAARLLGEEGVFVAFTGSGGAPLHYGALTSYSGTEHFRRLLSVYIDADKSLLMAKAMMQARLSFMREVGLELSEDLFDLNDTRSLERIISRFERSISSVGSIAELLGHEGAYTKALYAWFAQLAGLGKDVPFRRNPGGDAPVAKTEPDDIANRCIDHGNYLAYGFAGATLWALGIPPHMSVFHGKTRPGGLVFDLADCFKEGIVIPYAFAAASGRLKGDPEKVFRDKVMGHTRKIRILRHLVRLMGDLLPSEMAGPNLNPGTKP